MYSLEPLMGPPKKRAVPLEIKSQNNQFPYIVTSLKWMKWLVSIIQTGFRVETLAGLLLASSMNSLILY